MSDLCLVVPMADGNKKEKRVSVSILLTDSECYELRGCALGIRPLSVCVPAPCGEVVCR